MRQTQRHDPLKTAVLWRIGTPAGFLFPEKTAHFAKKPIFFALIVFSVFRASSQSWRIALPGHESGG